MIPPLPIADLAAAHYNRRLRAARDSVAAGQLPAAKADAALLPWLAIACRCGSEVGPICSELDIMAQGRQRFGPPHTITPAEEREQDRLALADWLSPPGRRAMVLVAAWTRALENDEPEAADYRRLADAIGVRLPALPPAKKPEAGRPEPQRNLA